MRAEFHNGGAFARTARGSGNNAVVAAGAGDAVEVNSAWQSRMSEGGIALSAKLIVSFTTTLAAGATLTFAGNFQDALDGTGLGAADFGASVPATVVATGAAGGSTETGTFEIDVDLSGAREFIRGQMTPNLSAGATDTAAWHMDFVFFGDHRQPITKSPVNIGSVDAL
ncbi:hypothetical protein GR212_15365 [Rhizobium lusitanum]|uniref:Uncharacterized protein n=1 Tax=Rhizobium lusitanum TaxID=293958 RepID=A0A6L9U9H7_9HYPH|nr:hypothetical protein [Rhizobium lusitanum]NEI70962.1 hypothetical protein [Rhizobium lusitanum]